MGSAGSAMPGMMSPHGSMMDMHAMHAMHARQMESAVSVVGQDAFGAIQEIVAGWKRIPPRTGPR